MSYIISQNLIYLLLAMLLGALIAWLLGLCKCNKDELISELESAKAERDALADRLANVNILNSEAKTDVVTTNFSEMENAKVTSLQDELKTAKSRIAELEDYIAIKNKSNDNGLGFVAASNIKDTEVVIDKDEFEALNARKSFLEKRVKFMEDSYNEAQEKQKSQEKPKGKPFSNENFVISEAGDMPLETLEAAVAAAGAGTQPKKVRRSKVADDLLLIEGVGPKNNQWLNENGIHYFWQIAMMTPAELAWLANNLPNFGKRVYRENWVKQCANLAKGLPPR